MENRFNAEEWIRLSTSERVHRCRLMEEEALKMAQHSSPPLQHDYFVLAEQWAKLASDLENATPVA